ncbi:MAG: hypothetical protein HY319_12030 [Armatimonadetes bacterium]|nr:hypothetical protein [Armatimonadota bacterium]
MRNYRFKIDLTALKGLGEVEPPPAAPAGDGFSPSELLEQVELLEQIDQAYAAALDKLGPSHRLTGPHPRRLAAGECLDAYNASLVRAQQAERGRYRKVNIDYHVFFDSQGNKHVVTRPVARPQQRISELILVADGSIRRLSYERVYGPLDDTEDLLLVGLHEIDKKPERFVRNPGYQLRITDYLRSGDELTRVAHTVYQFDPAQRALLEAEE